MGNGTPRAALSLPKCLASSSCSSCDTSTTRHTNAHLAHEGYLHAFTFTLATYSHLPALCILALLYRSFPWTSRSTIQTICNKIWVLLGIYQVTWDKEKLKTLVAVNESLNLDAILTSDNNKSEGASVASADANSTTTTSVNVSDPFNSSNGAAGVKDTAAAVAGPGSGSGAGGSAKARSRARSKKAAAPPPPPPSAVVAPPTPAEVKSAPPTAAAGVAVAGAYDLVAVVEHRGVGAHHGHYVGRMRSWLAPRDARWGQNGEISSAATAGGVATAPKSEANGEGKQKLPLQGAAAGQCEEPTSLAESAAANGWWLFDDTVVSKVELPAVLDDLEGAVADAAKGSSSSSTSTVNAVSASSSASNEVVDVVESDEEEATKGASGGGDKKRAQGLGFINKGAKQPRREGKAPLDSLQSLPGSAGAGANKNGKAKGKGKGKGKAEAPLTTATASDAVDTTTAATGTVSGVPKKKDVQAERLKAAKPSSDSYVLVYAARGLLEELQAEMLAAAQQQEDKGPSKQRALKAAAGSAATPTTLSSLTSAAAAAAAATYPYGPPPSARAAALVRTASLRSELAAHAKVVADQRVLVAARQEAYFKAFGGGGSSLVEGGGLRTNDQSSNKKTGGATATNFNDQLPPCVPTNSNDFVLVPTSWLKHWTTGVPPTLAATTTATTAVAGSSANGTSNENSGAASASAELIDDDDSTIAAAAAASTDDGSSSGSDSSPAAGSVSSMRSSSSSSSNLTSSNVFCEFPPPPDIVCCPHGTGGVSPAMARTLKRLSRAALVDMLHWVKAPRKQGDAPVASGSGRVGNKNSSDAVSDKSLHQQQQRQQSAKDVVDSLVASRGDAVYNYYCHKCVEDHQVACEVEALGASLRDRVLDGFAAADRQVAASRKQTFVDDGSSWGGGNNRQGGGNGEREPPMYLVSKVWATSFKQQCERLDAGKETTATASILPMVKSNASATLDPKLTSDAPETKLVALSADSTSAAASSSSAASSASESPTAPILCPHGELKPGGAGSQVRPISQDGWEAVMGLCPNAVRVPSNMLKCELCGAAKESDREHKKALESARKAHIEAGTTLRALHRRADNFEPRHFETLEAELECGGSWRVLRKAWLLKWRSWVDGSWQHEGSNPSRPPDLESSQDLATLLACPCGNGVLLTKQLEAVANRCAVLGSIPPGYGADAASHGHLVGLQGEGCQELELVSLAEYRELKARCKASDGANGAEDDDGDLMSDGSDDNDDDDDSDDDDGVHEASNKAVESAGQNEDDSKAEGGLVLRLGRSRRKEGNSNSNSSSSRTLKRGQKKHRQGALRLATTGDGTLVWRGAVLPCVKCIAKVRSEADARRASFTNAALNIHRLSEGAPIPAAPAAAVPHGTTLGAGGGGGGGSSGAPEPRPRRTARSAANAAVPVTGVGSADRVGLLKLKVWQVLGDLEPQHMALYHHGAELLNDDASLASYNVKANDVVHCRPLSGGSSSSGGGSNRRKSKIVVDSSDDDDDKNGSSSDKLPVQEIQKTLEDYFLYWGSERPESGQPAEKGFSDTLLNRRSPTTATTVSGTGGSDGAPMAIDVTDDDVTAMDDVTKVVDGNCDSEATCKACTFLNTPGSALCEMCGQTMEVCVK